MLCISGEVKFLEDIKSYFNQRKKIEDDYAEQIKKLDIHFLKILNNSGISFFNDVWSKLLNQSTKAANVLTKSVEIFDEVITISVLFYVHFTFDSFVKSF